MADTTFTNKTTMSDAAWFQDLNDLFYRGTKPLTVTSLVTTIVSAPPATNLTLGVGGGSDWNIPVVTGNFDPVNDNNFGIGTPTHRVTRVVTLAVDSGSGTLSLKGAGTLAVTITGANTQLAGTLGVTGAVTLSSTLGVTGASTLAAITGTGLIDISSASAGQIKFPAVQNSSADAHTLDDYVESISWTPVVGVLAGAFTCSPSGRYWKIGQLVFIQWTSGPITNLNGATTATVRVSNLPISVGQGQSFNPVIWVGTATAFSYMAAQVDFSSNSLFILGSTATATTVAGVQASQIGTGGSISGWAIYSA